MNKLILRIKKFILEDIWRISSTEISRTQFIIIRITRIIILAVKNFLAHNCVQKASGLTYYSLISIVPIVAMAFGIAKGFGFKEILESELQNQFGTHQEVVKWIMDFASNYLDSTKGGMIAGVGFAVLLWSVMKVIGTIEMTFNEIWDINKPRTFIRKFSDYLSLMIIAILFLISSSSMVVFVRQQIDDSFMSMASGIIFGFIIPYILIWLVFTMILYIIPNTRVKFMSAFIGGILSGTAFQLLQYYYINFQVNISTYNAIYGSFAAFPLFLIWLNTSWLIVLFGAELAYATQNVKNYDFEFDSKDISYYYRKQVFLLVAQKVVKCFVN